jgi:hypothetical protein
VVQTFGDTENFVDVRSLKAKKIPGTKDRGLYGSMIVHGDIDNSFKAYCNIYVKQGGEYRQMPFKILPQPICDLMNNEKTYVPAFVKVSNVTLPVPCPFPKVKHSFITKVLIQLLFCQIAYTVEAYKAPIPDALQLVVQTGHYEIIKNFKKVQTFFFVGEYAGESIIIDKDGEIVFTLWAYLAVVKV